MPHPFALACVLLLAPPPGDPGAPAATLSDGWTALPIPSLCRPIPEGGVASGLPPGTHLDLGESAPAPPPEPTAFALPLLNLIELLEADARREGTDLRLLRTAPPLLARGSAAGLERAKAVLTELDRLGEAQHVRLEGTLTPLDSEGGEPVAGRSARLRSGESLLVGEEESTGFLADYEVDVASGGGTANPRFGRAIVGPTARVTAWRTPGGDGVFLLGELDLAELLEVASFDTGTPELGGIECPRIASVTVRFSGLADADGRLRVTVRGAPLSIPDWRLGIRAVGGPDPESDWRAVDLAWLESRFSAPERTAPGAGLRLPPAPLADRDELEPLSASILWGELEASFAGRRADRPLFTVAPGILVAPTAEERIWSELDRVLAAATEARRATRTVSVRSGGLEVTLPAAEGLTCCVQAGIETTALVDFEVELAPDFWMPDPIVERFFDGLVLRGRLSGGELSGGYWISETRSPRTLERDQTLHGRVVLPGRGLRLGSLHVRSGERVQADAGLSVAVESL